MPKLSFNQFNDRQRGFKEDIELVARAGYEGIGISKMKLESYGIEAGLQLVKDSGLGVACYSATGRFLIPGELDPQVEETKRCIETAARLQASCLVIVTGPRHGLEWEEANRRFQHGLRQVLPEAERHGVRIAVEALPPFRTNMSYLHHLRDVLHVVDEIDSPHFGVLLDIWYHWAERDFFESVRRGVDSFFLVQISDHYPESYNMMYRAPLGQGVLPVKRVLHAIHDAGYAGWYEVEVFGDSLTEEQRSTLLPDSKVAFEGVWT